MVEQRNSIPNVVPIEEAMLLLATALEGQLEESDRPRLEQALLEHPSLRAAAADMALSPAEDSHDQNPLPIGLSRAAREAPTAQRRAARWATGAGVPPGSGRRGAAR